jgi:hypothetical protein
MDISTYCWTGEVFLQRRPARMPRRARVLPPGTQSYLCPVCSAFFSTPGGRASHQRQKDHFVVPRSTVLEQGDTSPEYRLNIDTVETTLALIKRRAKKDRQKKRRQARYDLLKEM